MFQKLKSFQSVAVNLTKNQRLTQKISFHKKAGIQALISGAFLLGQQYIFKNVIDNEKVQMAGKNEKEFLSSHESIELIPFSDEAYNEAIKNNFDVIIVVDPERFREDFVDEIKQFLSKVVSFQKMTKGRKIKFFASTFQTSKELKEFQEKYNVKVARDTILLLKNQYMTPLYAFNSYDWFENQQYLLKYFKKVTKVNKKNIDAFINDIDTLTSENVVIIGYSDKNDSNYNENKQKFGIMSLLKNYSDNPVVHTIFINDPTIAKQFGLEKSGDIYIMQKKSKYNYQQSNVEFRGYKFLVEKSSQLGNNLMKIINDNTLVYQKNNIFAANSFDKEQTKYTIVLETNENKLNKYEKQSFVKLLGQFHTKLKEEGLDADVQFVKINRNNQKKFLIYARDDTKAMLSAQAHQLTEQKEIDALNIDPKPHSYVYSFSADADLSSENLYHWFKKVREGEGEEYFKSQEAPFYRKYSKKLTGKTFQREVLMNDKDQAVFFYSKNCFACRQYGGVYEELGLEFLKQDRNIEFNRMNSDFNTLSCATNFPYTPVFQFYKKGAKEAPFVYRSDKFTPQLLKDFIEVSAEFKILPEEVFEKIYQNYQKVDLVEA